MNGGRGIQAEPLPRNQAMIERIEAAAAEPEVRFAFAGDSGAWPDPTADAIFSQLLRQVEALDPRPSFFVNLGDFAGPGTGARHEHYLEMADVLTIPNLCVVGNHDLDDAGGTEIFARVHGPMNYDFACGDIRFVALHAAPGVVGEIDVSIDPVSGTEGPREQDLVYLDRALGRASESRRVVLMHMPPFMDAHYDPHPEWGFQRREREFLDLLHDHSVELVCCAHGLAFDHHVHEGIGFVMSGGGGTGLCSHLRGVCAAGDGRPEDRGALFHGVEIALRAEGGYRGRVLQAFAPPGEARFEFGSVGN